MTVDADAVPVVLHAGSLTIGLAAETGALLTVANDAVAFDVGGDPLVEIALRDGAGSLVTVSSGDCAASWTRREDEATVSYSASVGSGIVGFEVAIRSRGSEFEFRVTCAPVAGMTIESIRLPGIALSAGAFDDGAGELFLPVTEGVLVTDPWRRRDNWSYLPMAYPNRGWCGYYPGNASMQYLSFTRVGADGAHTLYLASEDSEHTTKEIEYWPRATDVSVITRAFVSATDGYVQAYPVVLGILQGDWRAAARRYREWVEGGGVDLPPPLAERLPAPWIAESPLTVIYPVTGQGHHAGPTEPNEYFPYREALPVLRDIAEETDSRVLALLMHWEGTAPWSPPYVWPPRGGEGSFRDFVAEAHDSSIRVGLYCSGLGWTNTSNTGDGGYDRTADLTERGLLGQMCQGPRGEYECLVCNGDEIRYGYDICAATEFARQVLSSEATKIAAADVDYVQLLDQNLGGAAYQCYDTRHGHAPGPGAWQARAIRSTIASVRQALAEAGRADLLLGCEGAAAETFLHELPVNDLRFHVGFVLGRPVPAYSFVFHPYVANFMGNQVEAMEFIDGEASPWNLWLRIAHSFAAGDLLSAVLGPHGTVHWSWCTRWSVPPPPQQATIGFLRHLNAWRRARPDLLLYGRAEVPRTVSPAEERRLHLKDGSTLSYPAVLTSRWTSPEGTDGQFLINYTDTAHEVSIVGAVLVGSLDGSRASIADGVVVVPPLSAVLLELGDRDDGGTS